MEQTNFSEQEYDNLLQFADLCTDIESQATYLPGLGYLEAIAVYRRQMEGKIVDYSNSNGRVYPPFSRFCTTAQEHAKINNNPAAD